LNGFDIFFLFYSLPAAPFLVLLRVERGKETEHFLHVDQQQGCVESIWNFATKKSLYFGVSFFFLFIF
jgi:hypothetical protein